MGNKLSTVKFGIQLLKGIVSRIVFGWNPVDWQGDTQIEDSSNFTIPPFQEDENLMKELEKTAFRRENVNMLSDEQIIKICRQLEFWYSEKGGNLKAKSDYSEMVKLAENLVDQSVWYKKDPSSIIQVPKVRFGKTELRMPVVTCGGMRFQNTWLPDSLPLLIPKRKTVLASTAQQNVKDCIRACMKLGINHFETARLYGSSEYQMVEALYELMQEGEFKREDFIFQTKVFISDEKNFQKAVNKSWANIEEKLGYIDLFSLHAVSKMTNDAETSLAYAEEMRKEGKIRLVV